MRDRSGDKPLSWRKRKVPASSKKPKKVRSWGGTFFCWGNVTPHAEFNIWFNAEAAQTVFDSRDDIVEKDKSPS